MRAYRLEDFGSLDNLVVQDQSKPALGPNDVLVRVHARSLNFRDLLILRKSYPVPGVQGTIPLSDGAGEVIEVGTAVTRVAVGDRVAAIYFPRWLEGRLSSMAYVMEQFGCTRDGMLADMAKVPEHALVKIPHHLSYEEASTLPCAALTAWSALIGPRPIIPGESVLTIGTGGVALFALQFAKLFGARVIAITSSDEKIAKLKKLGADETVNYSSTPEWQTEVRKLTGGAGVDHVVESGSIDTLPKSVAAAAGEGQIGLVAALGVTNLDARVLGSPVTIRRVYVGSRAGFENMNRAIELHKLRPVVDQVFSFGDAKKAYEHFDKRNHFGKVVIGA
jgi:NADPH:quinone reductase-like Zn-dependent oxidoreductase